jgi:serine/threonine protein kinase
LELADGGELFDWIKWTGRFEEPLARYYFHQLISGLSHCHNSGFAHRDLKPENLMIDSNYTLKIADFGYAGPINGRDGKGLLFSLLGTPGYMDP